MKLFNLCLLLQILHFCGVLADSDCRTPNNEMGECIIIRNCTRLYAYLMKRPISAVHTNLLRRSHCGFVGEVPKVCCPSETTEVMDKADMEEDDEVLPSTPSNLLPSTSNCGLDLGRKILSGTETDLDEFPWMALLLYELPNGRQEFGCGGVLISDRYVLTAAHCLKGKSLSKRNLKSVRLGEFNKDSDVDCSFNGFNTICLKTPPINVNIEDKLTHWKYNPEDDNQKHDIALLRLERKVKYNDYIQPICLPLLQEERKKTYSGMNLTVAGWGQTENKATSSVKLKLLVPVIPQSDCKALYTEASKEISEKQMCAGGQQNKDSCRGDSGGPLMSISVDENGDSNWYLAGIVSYGPVPCGIKDWPGVYTRVSKYIGWIARHMKP